MTVCDQLTMATAPKDALLVLAIGLGDPAVTSFGRGTLGDGGAPAQAQVMCFVYIVGGGGGGAAWPPSGSAISRACFPVSSATCRPAERFACR